MAKLTSDDLLKAIEEMSVLELKEFLDAFEEKFDVTAAAPAPKAPMNFLLEILFNVLYY